MGFSGEPEEDYEAMNCQLTPPVSLMGHMPNTVEFSLCVHAICEFDQSIDISHTKKAIRDILLPHNPLFSCIMVSYILFIYIFILMGDFECPGYGYSGFTMS